uniref:Uncharacterized protein n=1 Tax=Streptomyces sp. NBC_00003 TaxID=2903608 RepID=A0AAU2UX40_9ACTN
MLIGGVMACFAAYAGIKSFESGFGPIICLVLLLFGLSIGRNAYRLLTANTDGAERLTPQLGIIATLSGVAIGHGVTMADLSTETAQAQLIGYTSAFVIVVSAITLCEQRSTKAYVQGHHSSRRRVPPNIG